MGAEEEGDYIYISLHCHHPNDSCIKMGSDEGHLNASLTVRDKVTERKERGQLKHALSRPEKKA